VAHSLTNIREQVASWDPHPTFFEITTALALLHFQEMKPELVILETGLGGRLDSTNATEPVVSILTPIDYDHQKWLGNTLAEIAGEKAGIIKAGIPVVSAVQIPVAAEVIRTRAGAIGASLTVVTEPFTRFPVALSGSYQQENAALAVAAFAAAGVAVSDDAVKRGLATVCWPARFQWWDDRTVIDGAHNPAGACGLARAWREAFGERRATVILATLADKDVAGLVAALAPIAERFLLPRIRSERALAPEELSLTNAGLCPVVSATILPSIAEAWQVAQQGTDLILVTGSLHFAGEALAFLRGQPAAYEECSQ
jgi:dihydrofolate synthase/folylpolyglutamate synthase